MWMRVEAKGQCVCGCVWGSEVNACVDACEGRKSIWGVFLHHSFTLFIFGKQQEILFKETPQERRAPRARPLKGSLTSLC